MGIANNCYFSWVNNLNHFCKDYLFCQATSYLACSDRILKSCISLPLFNKLRDFSYFTVIIPVLVVLVFIVLQLFSILSKMITCFLKKTLSLCMDFPPAIKPIYKKITLTPEQKEILINSLKKESGSKFKYLERRDLNKTEGDIEWLSKHGVFRHRGIPGLIFRMPTESFLGLTPQKQEVENMFNFARRCWLRCKKKKLDLIEVPRVGVENLGVIHQKVRWVMVMEELEFEPGWEAQFLLRKGLSENSETYPLLEQLEEQIIEFVFDTEYQDVKYDNLPILNRKYNEEPVRAAVIDFDRYKPNISDSLSGLCGVTQYFLRGANLFTILETEKAMKKAYYCASSIKSSRFSSKNKKEIKDLFESSKELLDFQNKQEEFHREKNIVTGRELLDVNVIAKEDFRDTLNSELGFGVATYILRKLNEEIGKVTSRNKICIRQIPLWKDTGELREAFETNNNKTTDEDYEGIFPNSLLNQVCRILVAKGVISSFKHVHPIINFWF